MCELPPIIDDFDPNSLQPILTPPQPMDFFDSEYDGHQTTPQQQQLWQQGRQQRPRRQRRQQQEQLPQKLKTSVVAASKQTPSSASAAAPAHTTTATTSTTVDRSSRSRSLSLDVDPGRVYDDNGEGVLGMSVVKRMESLEHEYKRVKRELLRGDDGGGGDDDCTEDPDLCQRGEEEEEEVESEAFGPDIPRKCPRNECPSSLRQPSDLPVVKRQRSSDKLLSIFGSDSHLNEGENGGRSMFFTAASSPCGGGGDGKAFEDCSHPKATTTESLAPSRFRTTTSKAVDDDDEVARPLHDLADQLVELRLSLQRAEVGSGGARQQRSVYTIPEEEGESGAVDCGGGGGNEGKEDL